MSKSSVKQNNFWQELKRRKVIRVIISYAASAYVLLEFTSIVTEPLRLPDWTLNLVLVLLSIGFVIIVVVSWIYDFTPRGIVKTESVKEAKQKVSGEKSAKRRLRLSDMIIAALVVAVLVLAYPRIFNKGKSLLDGTTEKKRSIAVLPFMNNTTDKEYDSWEYGISNLMITSLSGSDELTVIDNQTIYEVIDNTEELNYTSIGPDMAKEVATRINVESYIYGDFFLAGSTFRINLKLIDTKNSEVLYTDFEEGVVDNIIIMVGSLSEEIKDLLEIEVLRESTYTDPSGYVTTKSPEAYKYFIQGLELFWRTGLAFSNFREAVRLDSSFAEAYLYLSIVNTSVSSYTRAKELLLKAEEGRDRLSPVMRLWINAFKAQYFEKNPHRSINFFKQATQIDPLSRLNWYWLASSYSQVEDYNGQLTSLKNIDEINKQLGPWKFHNYYISYGDALIKLERYKQAQKKFREGLRFFPESADLIEKQALCSLIQNDTVTANQYIRDYKIALVKSGDLPDPLIVGNIGRIYNEAGQYVKAVELLALALEMRLNQDVPEIDTTQPGNNLFWYYNVLGWAQIFGDINIKEGIENEKKAMELSQNTATPNHPYILISLGLGYYKQGNYEEALKLFREAEKNMTIYYHYLHQKIQETEKSLASKIREQ